MGFLTEADQLSILLAISQVGHVEQICRARDLPHCLNSSAAVHRVVRLSSSAQAHMRGHD